MRGSLVVALVAVLLLLVVGCNVVTHIEHTKTVTVCSKEAVAVGSSHEYRVYTKQGTFSITDSHWPWTWRTNSSEVYGLLRVPGTYRIKYIGVRFSLLSMFQNIMSYTRVPGPASC